MSPEQEDAANWRMYESYKKLIAQQATLRYQLQSWGKTMYAVGHLLQNSVDNAEAYGAKLINLPEKEDIQRVTKEFIDLQNQITRTKTHLCDVGMDVK
jgi:hypothetical protein